MGGGQRTQADSKQTMTGLLGHDEFAFVLWTMRDHLLEL